jgi:hypothetical protein
MSSAPYTPNEFRAELKKIMPDYTWTVHKVPKFFVAHTLTATGTQSSGSNRLSTLEVTRIEKEGGVTYIAKSAGYGRRAHWLRTHTDNTLARALRGLQEQYKRTADTYRSHEKALEQGRIAAVAAAGSAT